MPGSKTPKLPASQIHSWPGCQRRTSSFHSIARRRSVLPASRSLASSTARVVLRMPGREDRPVASRRRERQGRAFRPPSAPAAFPASHVCRRRAPRARSRGARSAACRSPRRRGRVMRRRASAGVRERRDAVHLRAALADDAGEPEARILGDDRQMLIARNLANADDGDRIGRQGVPPFHIPGDSHAEGRAGKMVRGWLA